MGLLIWSLTPVLFWELDLVNNNLTWSDEVYRIFGMDPQEFRASYEAFLETVHPEDRSTVDETYSNSVMEGRDSYEIEHRIIRRSSGEIRFVHEKCEHFRDPAGQVIRSIGMVHDITERKQAEEALRESEERFHSLADSMPQLVWTALPDGTVDYYNQRYKEYREIKQIEGTAWEWAPVLHPDDLQPTVDAFLFLAKLAAEAGDGRAARKAIENAIKCDPGNPDPWRELLRLEVSRRQFPQAIAASERFMELEYSERPHLERAMISHRMGELEDAIEAVRRGIRVNSQAAAAHWILGWLLLQAQQLDEAVSSMEVDRSLGRKDAQSLTLLGSLHRELGQERQAEQVLREALQAEEDNAEALYQLALVFAESGRVAEAKELVSRLRTIDPYQANRLDALLEK